MCWCFSVNDITVVCGAGLAVLQRILDTAAERDWQVTSINLDTLTEAAFIKLLADLDYKKDFQIIIDCELERLYSILNLVKQTDASSSMLLHNTLTLHYKYYDSFL